MSADFCVTFESNFAPQSNEYVDQYVDQYIDQYNCIDLHDTPCTIDCKCCICNIINGKAPIYSTPQYSNSNSKPIEVETPITIEVNELIEDEDAISIEWCNYDCECDICSFIADDASASINVIPTHCVVSKIETETCIIWVTQHGSPNQAYGTECNCFGVEMEVDTEIETDVETELETESAEVME